MIVNQKLKPKGSKSNKKKRAIKYRDIDDCEIHCDVELVTSNDKARRCKCKSIGDNCGQESCLNRAMHYECPKKCENGDGCRNHRFQNVCYNFYNFLNSLNFSKNMQNWKALIPKKKDVAFGRFNRFQSMFNFCRFNF